MLLMFISSTGNRDPYRLQRKLSLVFKALTMCTPSRATLIPTSNPLNAVLQPDWPPHCGPPTAFKIPADLYSLGSARLGCAAPPLQTLLASTRGRRSQDGARTTQAKWPAFFSAAEASKCLWLSLATTLLGPRRIVCLLSTRSSFPHLDYKLPEDRDAALFLSEKGSETPLPGTVLGIFIHSSPQDC